MMESLAAIYNFNLISYISIVYKRVKMSSECKKNKNKSTIMLETVIEK